MPDDSFQPEKPHGTAKGSGGWGATLWTAAISAVLVFMLVALGLPLVLAVEGAGWGLALGAGALTFVVILGIGYFRGSSDEVEA